MPEPARGAGPSRRADVWTSACADLCAISYDDPSRIPVAVPGLARTSGGSWSCIWGPARDATDANLAFVAACTAPNGALLRAVVVLRGTDITRGDLLGDLKQVYEDLDVAHQRALPWQTPGGVAVAPGTLDGLETVAALVSGGRQLLTFVVALLRGPAAAGAPLLVTGHSLGGCLTTVVAPWLLQGLVRAGVAPQVVPVTFAAPTAGNAAFASYFDALFRGSVRVQNPLDVVPRAWADLASLADLYRQPCNIDANLVERAAIDVLREDLRLHGTTYAQPQTGTVVLAPRCAPGAQSWTAELAWQHHIATYIAGLGTSPDAC